MGHVAFPPKKPPKKSGKNCHSLSLLLRNILSITCQPAMAVGSVVSRLLQRLS